MQLEKHNNWVRHEKLTWFVFKFDIIHLWFTHVASHGIKDGFVLAVRNLGCVTELTFFRKKIWICQWQKYERKTPAE